VLNLNFDELYCWKIREAQFREAYMVEMHFLLCYRNADNALRINCTIQLHLSLILTPTHQSGKGSSFACVEVQGGVSGREAGEAARPKMRTRTGREGGIGHEESGRFRLLSYNKPIVTSPLTLA